MLQPATLSLETTARDAEVLTLDGPFDLSNAAAFELTISDLFEAGAPCVVVDLRGVSFLDSTMLRALVRVLRAAERRGGEGSFRIVRPNPVIWKVFVLTGLSGLFPAYPTLSKALAIPPDRTPA